MTYTTYMTKFAQKALAMTAVFAMVMSAMPMQAFGQVDPSSFEPINTVDSPIDDQGHVLICHSGGGKNFTDVNADAQAIVSGASSGHDNDSYDVIPAFYWDFGGEDKGFYLGKNWPSGKSFWQNNCKNPDAGTGYITVIKAFDGPQGPKAISDFTLEIDGDEVTSGVKNEFAASKKREKIENYTISESDIPDNYSLVSISCVETDGGKLVKSGTPTVNFELKDGDDVTCTVTNKYTAPATATGTLSVKKIVVGGEAATSSFKFQVDGGTETNFEADGQNDIVVEAGKTYTVTEVAPGGNYTPSYSCSELAVAQGQTTTCTITNTYVPPTTATGTIVVNKVTIPAEDPQSFDFITTGTGYAAFSLTDTATPNSQILNVGSYSVAETPVTGWTQTSAVCVYPNQSTTSPASINLAAGETVTCTFTNTKNSPDTKYGVLSVKKIVLGDAATSSFKFQVNGGTETNFEADGQNDIVVPVGTYNVTEVDPVGYTPSYNCSELSVTENATTTCEITNRKNDTPAPLCEVTVVSNDTDTVVEKGGAFAQILSFVHPYWTATFDASAKWIWGDNPVADPSTSTTQTFEKSFVWDGPVSTASIKVASDDGYTLFINGTEVGSDYDVNANYTDATADTYNVASYIKQGTNELRIEVTNNALETQDPEVNPAGLRYEMTIAGTDETCGVVPNPEVLSCEITASDLDVRRGTDITLSWSSVGASSASIDNGVGSQPTNGSFLVENLGSDTTYTMTVFGDYLDESDERETATCSVSIDTRSGGGGSGTRTSRPTPEVLGESTSTPAVLGDQVSVVPTGAPNAGNGGASHTTSFSLTNLLLAPSRLRLVK